MQGFLQAELVTEAHKGLKKRCIACSEFLMQNMEKLDAIVSSIVVATILLTVYYLCESLLYEYNELGHFTNWDTGEREEEGCCTEDTGSCWTFHDYINIDNTVLQLATY